LIWSRNVFHVESTTGPRTRMPVSGIARCVMRRSLIVWMTDSAVGCRMLTNLCIGQTSSWFQSPGSQSMPIMYVSA
jgi:hypothetical protein